MGSPYDFEFHLIWKVASTSFPTYFDCQYGNETVTEVDVGTKIPEGYKVRARLVGWREGYTVGVEVVLRSATKWA